MAIVAEFDRAPARRFAVIGCGSIGKRHIANLQRLGVKDIVACDTQAARRAAAAQLGVETTDNLAALWRRQPEVCLVATPTSSHLALALEAAERGCHLFIEKPLSHDKRGIDRLLDCVRRRRLTTLVGCNMRFHPGLRAVKELLRARAVGRLISARVEVGYYLPDWHPAEDYRKNYSARRELGGGVILDAIHEIDYVRWLAGEVSSVTCLAEKLSDLEIDTEDTAAILLRFESGAFGEVHLDYVQRAYNRTCQIVGDEGTIHWDFSDRQVRFYSAPDKRWNSLAGPAGWETNQMYVDEMSHFLRCIDGDEEPESSVFDGAKVLQIALAAKTSAAERRWIELGSPEWPSARL